MVTEYISQAWKAYKRNLWDLIGAIIIMWIIILVPIAIAIVPVFVLLVGTVPLTGMDPQLFFQSFFSTLFTNIPVLIFSAILFIIAMLLSIALSAGFIKITYDSLKGRARVDTMINVARKKFWTVIGANVFSFLIMAVLGFALMFSFIAISFLITSNTTFSTVMFLIGGIIWFLMILLFFFVDHAIVIDNHMAIDSVKKSVKVASKNYVDLLALIIIFFLLMLVFAFIPFIGFVVINFIISPVFILALTALYVKKRRAR